MPAVFTGEVIRHIERIHIPPSGKTPAIGDDIEHIVTILIISVIVKTVSHLRPPYPTEMTSDRT